MPVWAPPALPTWWAGASQPAFVGRREEFDALEQVWADVQKGSRQVVFVGGEPGAGKSRLVSEAAAALSRAGVAVLVGHCLSDSPVAYQPFRDPIRSLLPAVDSVVDPQSRADVRDRLTSLVGLEGGSSAGLAERAGQARDHFDAVVDILRGVCLTQPVALVLEDLHWATPSTLQMLSYVVHHLTDSQLLIIATHRPTPPDRSEPVVATITDLYRDHGVHRIDLSGLNTSDVAEFLRLEAQLPADRAKPLASQLRDETGGNPFFLQEICRDMRAQIAGPRGGSLRVPGTIRDAFAARLGTLDDTSRDVVELAAVLGERIPIPLLIEAGSFDEDVTLACIERAVDRGLLSSVPGGTDCRFAHALARQAVLDAIPPMRRSRHHARAGRALEKRPAPGLTEAQQLAGHFSRALGEGTRVKARHYLMRAGRLTERALAHEEAAGYFEQAAAMSDDPAQAQEALLLAVPCLVDAGRFTSAMELSRRVATESGNPETRLAAATAHEMAGRRFGEADSAALLSDALHDYGADHDDPAYVRALASLGRAIGFIGMTDEAVALSDSTLARARQMGDEELLAHVLGTGLWHGLSPAHASTTLARAQELAALAKYLRNYDALGSAGFFRCTLGYMMGEREEIELASADMQWAAERSGLAYYEFWVATIRYGMRFIRGDFAGAERDADEVRSISSDWQGDDTEGLFGVQMFMVRRETGRLAEVRALITGDEDPQDFWAPGLLALYTELRMLEPAQTLLGSLMEQVSAYSRRSATWPAVLGFLVEAALFVQAEDSLRRLRPFLADYQGLNLASGQFVAMLGSADRYLACVDSALGDGDPRALFDAAEALDARSGSRVHLATTLAARAGHLARSSSAADRREALAAATRARAMAEPVGHRRVVALADDVISSLDDHVAQPAAQTPRRPSGPARRDPGLSGRELEVLSLMVAGASNQEISEQLVISPHTAANHVRSILIKTGATNRTQAATLAVAQGWVQHAG